ncbi:hypothetical protein BASA62_005788 [Batrachochytrium salamandrivorans]|nr:hypothetical protein BASA62_005788 [Batrachochytrium salamandrivorans]
MSFVVSSVLLSTKIKCTLYQTHTDIQCSQKHAGNPSRLRIPQSLLLMVWISIEISTSMVASKLLDGSDAWLSCRGTIKNLQLNELHPSQFRNFLLKEERVLIGSGLPAGSRSSFSASPQACLETAPLLRTFPE